MRDDVTQVVLTIDRIEGELAVLVDDAQQVHVPLAWLPADTGEGSALRLTLEHDPVAEAALRERIASLLGSTNE